MSSNAEPTEAKIPQPTEDHAESLMNLTLSDPQKWGWMAIGGVTDLLTPHERSRRRSTMVVYRKQRRRRTGTSSVTRDRKDSTPAKPAAVAPGGRKMAPAASIKVDVGGKSGRDSKTQPVAPLAAPIVATLIGEPSTGDTSQPPKMPATSATSSITQTVTPGEKRAKTVNKILEKSPSSTVVTKRAGVFRKLGLGTEFLGMSITESKGGANNELSNRDSSKGLVLECTVDSLKDGILDMYAYHRGREGMEPRNPETGELLCDLDATDTNYDCDAPRLGATITIEFPLEDEADVIEEKTSGPQAIYKDTLHWDLSDPTIPSPLSFATDVANEYGLSFGKMMNLAFSIQQQIDSHLQQSCSYSAPLAMKDPNGNERRFVGPTIRTQRFDQVLQTTEGGIRVASKESALRQQQRVGRQTTNSSVGNSAARRRTSLGRDDIECDSLVAEEDVELEYREELKRRSQNASVKDVAQKCKNGIIGVLQKRDDFHCHVCHKRAKVVYTFACGVGSHTYCVLHCKQRFGITADPGEPWVFEYCPICSLNCSCSKCSRKLESLARDFKQECEKQDTTAELTKFDDILGRCSTSVPARTAPRGGTGQRRKSEVEQDSDQSRSTSGKAAKPRKSVGARAEERRVPMVPKPPLTDFPREVCGLLELEPGIPNDYLRVYAAEGSYLVNNFPEVWYEQEKTGKSIDSLPSKDGGMVEDGNVDFCHECQNHGNLLCCDYCPRAFHLECLEQEKQSASNERWECAVCKKEKEGFDDDVVDGKKSLDLILASFLDANGSDEKVLESMRVLSIIHEMLMKLMEYDFGYMFCKPVDSKAIPGYKDIVKHPMDLGTICAKLINGGYSDILKMEGSFDDVITEVLKEIELVWQNCFMFNFEGSAIYRMANVHRRRTQTICERSFNHLLPETVKTALQEYVKSFDKGKGKFNPAADASPSTIAKENAALRFRKPKGKNKITVKIVKAGASRPVAILDPVSGRIVKTYSTMKSAVQAACSIISLGHRCEWSPGDVRAIIQRSGGDPSFLLFGYRWLMLDELRTGKVKFTPRGDSADVIEMRQDDCTFVFLSVDEALSCSDLPKALPLDDLRDQLEAIPPGSVWKEIFGKQWRRPKDKKEEMTEDSVAKKNGLTVLLQPEPDSDVSFHVKQDRFMKESIVMKEDLVTSRRLVGFETVSASYQDWKRTALSSPIFPGSEARTLEQFQKFYLDGDRNIDGIVWRGVEQSRDTNDEQKAELGGNSSEKQGSQHNGSCENIVLHNSTTVPALKKSNGITGTAAEERKDSNIPCAMEADTESMQIDSPDAITKPVPSASGKRKRNENEEPAHTPPAKLPAADDQSKKLNTPLDKEKASKDSVAKDGSASTVSFSEKQKCEATIKNSREIGMKRGENTSFEI